MSTPTSFGQPERRLGAEGSMRVVKALAAGPPSDLTVADASTPKAIGDRIIVKVLAAGVNRSDTLACRGIIPGPFPRILGRDFAGIVVEGPPSLLDRRVWGSGGGDIGMTTDGSHAQYLAVSSNSVAVIPNSLSFVEAAASGLSYFTAAYALKRAGEVRAGQTCIVSGAAGGVGGAAAALAARAGARVVGIVKNNAERDALTHTRCTELLCSDEDGFADRLVEVAAGAATAVDVIGGTMTQALLPAMGIAGGICILGAPPAAPLARVDTLNFYRQELRLVGLHTGRLTARDSAAVLTDITPGFESGDLDPSSCYGIYEIEDAARAYDDVEAGVPGRPVLVPHGTRGL